MSIPDDQGFSYAAALSGRMCPIVFLGENVILLYQEEQSYRKSYWQCYNDVAGSAEYAGKYACYVKIDDEDK